MGGTNYSLCLSRPVEWSWVKDVLHCLDNWTWHDVESGWSSVCQCTVCMFPAFMHMHWTPRWSMLLSFYNVLEVFTSIKNCRTLVCVQLMLCLMAAAAMPHWRSVWGPRWRNMRCSDQPEAEGWQAGSVDSWCHTSWPQHEDRVRSCCYWLFSPTAEGSMQHWLVFYSFICVCRLAEKVVLGFEPNFQGCRPLL